MRKGSGAISFAWLGYVIMILDSVMLLCAGLGMGIHRHCGGF